MYFFFHFTMTHIRHNIEAQGFPSFKQINLTFCKRISKWTTTLVLYLLVSQKQLQKFFNSLFTTIDIFFSEFFIEIFLLSDCNVHNKAWEATHSQTLESFFSRLKPSVTLSNTTHSKTYLTRIAVHYSVQIMMAFLPLHVPGLNVFHPKSFDIIALISSLDKLWHCGSPNEMVSSRSLFDLFVFKVKDHSNCDRNLNPLRVWDIK